MNCRTDRFDSKGKYIVDFDGKGECCDIYTVGPERRRDISTHVSLFGGQRKQTRHWGLRSRFWEARENKHKSSVDPF